jgi:hypothetical protein
MAPQMMYTPFIIASGTAFLYECSRGDVKKCRAGAGFKPALFLTAKNA